jgi:hypothetical protein
MVTRYFKKERKGNIVAFEALFILRKEQNNESISLKKLTNLPLVEYK